MSAAAAGAQAAGSIISAVSELLPTTTTSKGRTIMDSTASSDTESAQLSLGGSSTTAVGSKDSLSSTVGTSLNATDTSNFGTTNERGSQKGTGSSVTNSSQSEQFSGQDNKTITQTMLSDPAVMRIMNMMLQGDGQTPGLQAIVSGERNAGIFNSSTNQLLSSDLMTRVSGEVARLGAATVKDESLGATSTNTQGTSTTNTISDMISNIASNFSNRSLGKEKGSTTSDTKANEQTFNQTDVLDFLGQLASQHTDQEAHSDTTNKTKSKSSKCPFSIMLVTSLGLADNVADMEDLRSFRDTHLAVVAPEQVSSYYTDMRPIAGRLLNLDHDTRYRVSQHMYSNYILPMNEAHRAGDNESAHKAYLAMIAELNTLRG